MAPLTEEKCVPCREGAAPATEQQKADWIKDIPGWKIKKEDGVPELERSFKFVDFKQALTFVDLLGEEAEKQDHHPSVLLEWGEATVCWSTHKIKNLHRNDFIMAAKTDRLYDERFAKK